MYIPFKRLNFSACREEINKLLESGFIGLGDKVFEFEIKLAEFLGCKYVIATDSCTSALFICLKYDRPVYASIPSMTVPLVANAVIEAGVKLFFNDDTYWVGSSYPLRNTLIFDSAHQLERNQLKLMQHKRQKFCFSFYPTKIIGSADGGAIATNDPEFAEWARSVVTYGRNQKQVYQNSWEYDTVRQGYKRHYTNLQAVICLNQLERLDETNEARRKVLKKFNEAFGLNNESLYLYRIKSLNRDFFISEMKKEGIECGVHFKPLHLMTAFNFFQFEPGNSSAIVEREYNKTVSIPFYETLTESEQDHIIRKVKEFS